VSTPLTFTRILPADGTVDPANSLAYIATRDRAHVVPWRTVYPGPGEVWRVNTIWVTKLIPGAAYLTVTIAPNDILRSAGSPPGSLVHYGDALHPVSHPGGWGMEMKANVDARAIDCGGEILRGDGPLVRGVDDVWRPSPIGMAIWTGAWPGNNPQFDPTQAPGISLAIHGERLA
jgi:hypothetical protein